VSADGDPKDGSVLQCATPDAWVEAAVAGWRELLCDHAACEKKAASTALALMFAYAEDTPLVVALSRLAREELRHFEQVQKLMAALKIPCMRLRPGRYAAGLRAATRSTEPHRKLDLLLVGALIEARSCERFRALAPRLPAPAGGFYAALATSEARHFESYLGFARAHAPGRWQARLAELAGIEAQLAAAPARERLFLG
jgi:tRNA-(ms[2]io[6]A)-hydroxylase